MNLISNFNGDEFTSQSTLSITGGLTRQKRYIKTKTAGISFSVKQTCVTRSRHKFQNRFLVVRLKFEIKPSFIAFKSSQAQPPNSHGCFPCKGDASYHKFIDMCYIMSLAAQFSRKFTQQDFVVLFFSLKRKVQSKIVSKVQNHLTSAFVLFHGE